MGLSLTLKSGPLSTEQGGALVGTTKWEKHNIVIVIMKPSKYILMYNRIKRIIYKIQTSLNCH